MNAFTKISIISLIALLPSLCLALPSSKIIDISSTQTALPLDIAEVEYTALKKETVYDIKCKVTSDDKSLRPTSEIKVFAGNPKFKFYINDQQLNDSLQGKIKSTATNTIKVTGVYRDMISTNTITVSNIDDTDTITVSDCRAKAEKVQPS